ncbi:MAG: chemotaxis protein CheB [Gammaproteobacteria bacterium]|nr:chemotaxis protein CheB [Gammaproteobacteria bacterium]
MIESLPKSELGEVKLAIVSDSLRHRQQIRQVMERNGLRVVFSEPLTPVLLDKLHGSEAEVLLLDVDERIEHYDVLLEQLLEESEIPIIFNDVSGLTLNEPTVLAKWYGKLLGKIAELTGKFEWDHLDFDLGSQTKSEILAKQTSVFSQQDTLAQNIWVLGASLGGPDAIKQFLGELPANLPVALILAQHLGANFMGLLAEQLDRITAFKVMPASVGHVLRHGEVIVVPVHERLHLNPIGAVELHSPHEELAYSPSIDTVLVDMAQRYGKNCHCIIFSGMCDDGVVGADVLSRKGGEIWTQEPRSCVISAMPDNVRDAGCSTFSGTPRQLAHKLIQRYR